jgi:hypothetical protein
VPLSRNLGTLTSWNPLGHVTGLLYLYSPIYFAVSRSLKLCVEDSFCFNRNPRYSVYKGTSVYAVLSWVNKSHIPVTYWSKNNFNINPQSTPRFQKLISCIAEIKLGIVFIKCTLVQALRFCRGRTAYRGSRGIALPFIDHGTSRGEGSASHPGRSLPPGKNRYPLYRRLGGPRAGLDRCGKSRPHRDSIPGPSSP